MPTCRAISPSASVRRRVFSAEMALSDPASSLAAATASESFAMDCGEETADISVVSSAVARVASEFGAPGSPMTPSIRPQASDRVPVAPRAASIRRRSEVRKGFSVRPDPETRTPDPKPPSESDESSVVRLPKPGVMAFDTLLEIVSARRDAAVRPEVAFPRALFRFIGRTFPQSRRDQRFRFAVSWSISSTVWMILAFDE